jgi:hypothetical protein
MKASPGGRKTSKYAGRSLLGLLGRSLLAFISATCFALAESPLEVGTVEPPPATSTPDAATLHFQLPPAPSIDSLPTTTIPEKPQAQSSEALAIAWSDTAQSFGDEDRKLVRCPPGGMAGAVSGTDLYTDDSSICSAGVHAGLIALETGGVVTVEMRPGQMAFAGSTRYGLTSSRKGVWPRSFMFVEPEIRERVLRVAGVAFAGDCSEPTDSLVAALGQSCDGKDRCTFNGANSSLAGLSPSCSEQALVIWQCGAKSSVAMAEPDASGGLTVTLACGPEEPSGAE